MFNLCSFFFIFLGLPKHPWFFYLKVLQQKVFYERVLYFFLKSWNVYYENIEVCVWRVFCFVLWRVGQIIALYIYKCSEKGQTHCICSCSGKIRARTLCFAFPIFSRFRQWFRAPTRPQLNVPGRYLRSLSNS